jgi:hypothetical protein
VTYDTFLKRMPDDHDHFAIVRVYGQMLYIEGEGSRLEVVYHGTRLLEEGAAQIV